MPTDLLAWQTNDGRYRYYGVHQHFTRCVHFPSAINNFFAGCRPCSICTEPPKWFDNGFHQPRGETR